MNILSSSTKKSTSPPALTMNTRRICDDRISQIDLNIGHKSPIFVITGTCILKTAVFTIPQFSYRFATNPEDVFKRGLSAHQAGDLRTAKVLYSEVLTARPKHAGALHFLGVVEGAIGSAELAIEYIQRAIELEPARLL